MESSYVTDIMINSRFLSINVNSNVNITSTKLLLSYPMIFRVVTNTNEGFKWL